jgi:pimeloyl-ACP methyl ester carboxylesterase
MTHRATVPVALLLAFAACERQPAAPRPPADEAALARSEDTGPPSAHDFGPDSREIGEPYTGQGVESEGLNCTDQPSGRRQCTGYLASGVDGTMLDVTVDLPGALAPYPLVVLMHGWAGSKSGSGDIAEKLLADGYAVLRYSARGFGDSWGKVNLSDIGVEVGAPSDPAACVAGPPGDLQSMIGKVVDDPQLTLNPDAVAVTGASYGGGQSWLAAIQPRFLSPAGGCVRIRTIVPIVPWTDLLFSLVPNGRSRMSIDPVGGLKFSYVNALYFSGFREPTEKRPFDNYPNYLKEWHALLNGAEPLRANVLFQPIVDGLAGYRSIWWQESFWNMVASAPEPIPVFQVQGVTDDLFTFEEAKRMLLALKAERPSYPIASYFGDIGHPRARNHPREVDYALELIRGWLAYYLKGSGAVPQHVIYAAITQPSGRTFDPSNVITVPTYADLATREIKHRFKTSALIVNPGSGGPSGPMRDPLLEVAVKQAGELQPLPGQAPLPAVPDPTAATYDVSVQSLTGGPPLLIAGQPSIALQASTTGVRVQLNVRLLDVSPKGTMELITRGTYTLESAIPDTPLGTIHVTIPTAGNLWRVDPGHVVRLEIVNVDAPYMRPSAVPSSTQISRVELRLPVRD